MEHHIRLSLDDAVWSLLDSAARERGISLSAYLHEIAVSEAKRIRRERIRAQSNALAACIAECPEARDFYEDWSG